MRLYEILEKRFQERPPKVEFFVYKKGSRPKNICKYCTKYKTNIGLRKIKFNPSSTLSDEVIFLSIIKQEGSVPSNLICVHNPLLSADDKMFAILY